MTSITAALVAAGFGIYEHVENRGANAFYLLIASVALYSFGGYLAYAKVQDRLEEEIRKCATVGGPEIFIGYEPQAKNYPRMIIVNSKGKIAYNVVLKIPEDGSKITSKEINILRDDGTYILIPCGHNNEIDRADIVMEGADDLPVFVTCMDSDCLEFVYHFQPTKGLGSGSVFTLVNKRCKGRVMRSFSPTADTQD